MYSILRSMRTLIDSQAALAHPLREQQIPSHTLLAMVATVYQLTTFTEYGELRTTTTAIATVSETATIVGNAGGYEDSPKDSNYPSPTSPAYPNTASSETSVSIAPSPTEQAPDDNDGGLSPGAIAGIAAGSSVAAVSLLLAAIFAILRLRHGQRDRRDS